jgi:hypothetical protein
MDITKYVAEYREAAFLVGDYSSYRAQLSRRLRIVRKKLGRATAKNAKYAAKAPVTAQDVAKNIEYARLGQIDSGGANMPGFYTFSSSPPSGHGRTPWP